MSATPKLLLFFRTVLTIAGSAMVSLSLEAGTLRVDAAGGSDVAGCGSETTPCASIQKAVNDSSSGDEILVAAGTYTYDATLAASGCPSDDLQAVVCVRNKVLTIEGGYTAGDWQSADPQSNVTTIDGENTNRGVLVVNVTTPSALILEGVTVTRGHGGWTNNDINAWGGGIYAKVADLTVKNVMVSDCVAKGQDLDSGRGGTGAGGGIAVRGNAEIRPTVFFENVTCDGNTAQGGTGPERGGGGQGGGMWLYYADVTGDELVFSNNNAFAGHSNGDGVYNGAPGAQGGGVAFKQESVTVFTNVTAIGNTVIGGNANSGNGAAGFAFGGGLYGEVADFTVTDLFVSGNTVTGGDAATAGGGFGGGVYSLNSDVALDRAEIILNIATGGNGVVKKGTAGGGAGLFADDDGAAGSRNISVANSILADNSVILGTGGNSSVSGGGGAIFLNGAQAEMTHCTLARNTLSTTPTSGRAIVLVTRGGPVPSNLSLDYSIVSDHTLGGGNDGAVRVNDGSAITFSYGIFANNVEDTDGTGTFNGLATMDSETSVGYVSSGSPDYDYHIQASSPARDAAISSTVTTDIDGEDRDSAPDHGADEYGSSLHADGFESGDTSGWSTTVG